MRGAGGEVDVERIHRHPRTWPLDPETGQVTGRARARRLRGLRDARRGRGGRGSRAGPRRLDRRGPGRRPRAQPAGRDRPDRGRHGAGPRPRADGGDPDARRAHRQPHVHRLPAADGARHAAARHRPDRGSRARPALRRQGRGRAADRRLDGGHRVCAARRQRAAAHARARAARRHRAPADGRAHVLRRARAATTTRCTPTGRARCAGRARCWTRSSAASSATRRSACSTAPAASARRPSASRCAATTCSRPTSRPLPSSAPHARRRRWARRSRPASPTSRACAEQVEGTFACVLACDNAVAHLHGDEDLARFAAGVAAKLEPGGLARRQPARLRAARGRARGRPSRARRAGHDLVPGLGLGRRRPHATSWRSSRCAARASSWQTACRRTRLRALLRDELCGALAAAGLADVRWRTPEETGYYQPIVTGAAAAEERSYRPGHALLATRRPPRPRRHPGLERPPPGLGAPRARRGRDHADDRRSRLRDAARRRRGRLRLDARRPHALRVLPGRRGAARARSPSAPRPGRGGRSTRAASSSSPARRPRCSRSASPCSARATRSSSPSRSTPPIPGSSRPPARRRCTSRCAPSANSSSRWPRSRRRSRRARARSC